VNGTVVVTGCAGFIGSHLVEALLDEGFRVHGVDSLDDFYPRAMKLRNLATAVQSPRFSFHEIDLAEGAAAQAFADTVPCDVVVHLAGLAGVRLSLVEPSRYVRANVVATQHVLDAWSSSRRKVPLVFASSSSVYGNGVPAPFREDAPLGTPPSPYAATKRACELLCDVAHAIHEAPITMLRLFTVYGPRQRPDLAIRKFATAILEGSPVPMFGDGSMARDFTHVSDVVQGIRAAMNERSGKRIVNLGNSSPVEVRTLIDLLGELVGRAAEIESIPRPPGEMDVTFADTQRAEALWGWRPRVPFRDGLTAFVAWLEAQPCAERAPSASAREGRPR
jgi:UDP-glucuronate 4-epimerase